MRPPIVVMGVSGSGKSTLGAALAARLGFAYIDGDDLHSPANIAKMRAGVPLGDEDRAPWLHAVGTALRPGGVVIASSALKRAYRDRLRAVAPGTRFLFLDADPALIARRLAARRDHFMAASLADSQFAALERPTKDERDVKVLDAAVPLEELLEAAQASWADGIDHKFAMTQQMREME